MKELTQGEAEVIINAIKVQGIDLEPTEEEIDTFLVEGQQAREQEGQKITEAEAEIIAGVSAMNRLNESGNFATETEERLNRKRELLLKWMAESHDKECE